MPDKKKGSGSDNLPLGRIFYSELKDRNQITLPAMVCKTLKAGKGSLLAFTLIGDDQFLVTHMTPDWERQMTQSMFEAMQKRLSLVTPVGKESNG